MVLLLVVDVSNQVGEVRLPEGEGTVTGLPCETLTTWVLGLKKVGGEVKTIGVERLMVQGDGGSVRTFKLAPSKPGDEGYGKTTAKRKKPRRKRATQNREVITLEVREPGQWSPKGLDVVVPCEAAEGLFQQQMVERLEQAMGEGRISADQVAKVLGHDQIRSEMFGEAA